MLKRYKIVAYVEVEGTDVFGDETGWEEQYHWIMGALESQMRTNESVISLDLEEIKDEPIEKDHTERNSMDE